MEGNSNLWHGKNNYGSKNNREVVGGFVRKGPWKPEEDQVLLNHVHKYGPRDWSSIRSNALLLRSGKSCRLRWVNKLRPNLKNCKFTAEEERVVIELQAQLGNKWATIATHLQGRTDNDVKNFWSSRQKRLARLLQSQSPQRTQKKRNYSSSGSITSRDNPSLFIEVPRRSPSRKVRRSSFTEGETSSRAPSSSSSSYTGASSNTMQIIPYSDMANQDSLASEADNPLKFGAIPVEEYPRNIEFQQEDASFASAIPLQTYLPFPIETQELIERLDSGFLQMFGCTEEPNLDDDGFQFLSCYEEAEMISQPGEKGGNENLKTPDSFFDDFPSDMFDQIEPLPSPSTW